MLSSQHTNRTNFHRSRSIPVICLKSHLHWDVSYDHDYSDHFHNAGQLDAVTLAHLIKPISV